MKKVFWIVLFLSPICAFGSVHPATCTQASIDAAVAAATETGAIVDIAACPAGQTWTGSFMSTTAGDGTYTIKWIVPDGGVFRCAGSATPGVRGTNGQTLFEDNFSRVTYGDHPLLTFQVDAGKTFEMMGCTFHNQHTEDAKNTHTLHADSDYVSQFGGTILISGIGTVKIHHNFFNFVGGNVLYFIGNARGVLYENRWTSYGSSNIIWGSGYGDTEWSEPTAYGTDKFLFFEENDYVNYHGYLSVVMTDSLMGARYVVRNNKLFCAALQTHGLTPHERRRGTRALEIYRNDGTDASTCVGDYTGVPGGPFFDSRHGNLIIWGNNIGMGVYHWKFKLQEERRGDFDGGGYSAGGARPPNVFGYCGPAPQSGSVNVGSITGSGTTGDPYKVQLTWVSGGVFDGAWLTYSLMGNQDAQASLMYINGLEYKMHQVIDSTHMTVMTTTSTFWTPPNISAIAGLSGVAYEMGSNIDRNDLIPQYGAPCLDQTGVGQGDLIAGDFPNVKNVTRSNATFESANWGPHQILEPVTEFMNIGTCNDACLYYESDVGGRAGWYSGSGRDGGVFVQNLVWFSGSAIGANCGQQVSSSSPFDGTPAGWSNECGVGFGPIALRPTVCSTNAFYWATDEGEWDSLNPGPDGKMYWCQSTNSWVASYGANNTAPAGGVAGLPYTFPHPLRNVVTPPPPTSGNSSRLRLGH